MPHGHLDFLIFQEGKHWVAQCIQHTIAAEAVSREEIIPELRRTLWGPSRYGPTRNCQESTHFRRPPIDTGGPLTRPGTRNNSSNDVPGLIEASGCRR